MSFYFYIFLFFISSTKIYSLNIHKIQGSSLKVCEIKFPNEYWLEIENCYKTNFNKTWSGGIKETNNLFIDYNLGDRVNISIKSFYNLPSYDFEDYCSIYIIVFINEYYIDNERDFIYYCNNCDCTQSNGEKTFCHKWTDKREYCKQESGKEYNFFIRINGLNELNLMNTNLHNKNYYKLIGRNYYLEDNQEILPLKFSSNSVLIVNYDKRHKVNLNELLIQYSFNGDGEFYTNNNKKLNNSGKIGEDIYFKKLTNLTKNSIYKMKLTAQTICKFGIDKYNSTSNIAEFIFYYCANGYKMYNQSSCYKCFESCFNCSEPGNNNYHNCHECNSNNSYYYFNDNNTKNCYSSCKNANKLRKEKDNKICINKEDCKNYISSDEEICLNNCIENSEYFYYENGKISKNCIKYCNDWISEDNTTCTIKCEYLNRLSDSSTYKCVTKCESNSFYNPEFNGM